ncbi:energy-converting hydrogenase A subunit G [Methanomicrobium sp. W14]|uniref:EhaG family protein n=1 Tax=Methanomicrobium sp. W14 TaxID=2817839 RepID=UPI001AE71298|nr:EhaG family protein [Methanomicrobium sp. W14]MBP2132343.1 energy-converting hydrogenase A subunit G [Methanomicrobium sp. W14]
MIPAFFSDYSLGLFIAFVCVIIAFYAMLKETDDLHRLLLTDLVEVVTLSIIALVGTDLAEALILPGLVVGIAEILAMSELYIEKESLFKIPENFLDIEVMETAPKILSSLMLLYGIVLSGFTGGAVAGLGLVFYFMCRKNSERTEILETVSGYAWALWVLAFIIFMTLPQYWFFAIILAGTGVFAKVAAKMTIVGTMRGGNDV